MSRPYRAIICGPFLTQGVALGWYVTPRQGYTRYNCDLLSAQVEIFLRYAVSCADLDEEDINEALKNMPTLAQKWLEQGRQETIRETIARLDSLGLDIEIICQAVALPRGEVEMVIQTQHTKESH